MKRCPKCREIKPSEEFHKNKSEKSGLQSWCKICRSKYSRENMFKIGKYQEDWRTRNKEYKNKCDKEYRERNREKFIRQTTACHRRQHCGISPEEYDRLYKMQHGKCAICGKSEQDNGKQLAADHNHSTGEFRGLLCITCNLALGYIYDNIELLENMLKYLERHEQRNERHRLFEVPLVDE